MFGCMLFDLCLEEACIDTEIWSQPLGKDQDFGKDKQNITVTVSVPSPLTRVTFFDVKHSDTVGGLKARTLDQFRAGSKPNLKGLELYETMGMSALKNDSTIAELLSSYVNTPARSGPARGLNLQLLKERAFV
jgi:hypothetical protein